MVWFAARGLSSVPSPPVRSLSEDQIKDALGSWFDATGEAIHAAVCDVEARLATQSAPDVAGIQRDLDAARSEQRRLVHVARQADEEEEIAEVVAALKEGKANVKRLEAALTRATTPRTDARLIGRQIEKAAVQRLDALRAALHGPNARDALHALFPQGIRVRLAPDVVDVDADGVVIDDDVLTMVRQPDNVRLPDLSPPNRD